MRSGIGDTLRAARRAQGRTLSDAAAATRVRETYLAALEQGDFGVLGGDVYARGFLRSYARYLQLDPEPLIQEYLAEVSGPEPRGRGRSSRRWAERPSRLAGGAQPAGRPGTDGSHAGGGQPPQERPPGAAVLLLLVVIVLVVIAVVGLRGVEVGAAAVAAASALAVEERTR